MSSRAPVIAPKGRFRGREILEAKRRHLEPPELKRLFSALNGDDFWQPYFRIAYYWGCRVSEPAIMLVEDVSDEQIVIRRLKKKQENHPGGFEEHVYDIPDDMQPEFDRIMAWREEHGLSKSAWLFPSPYRRGHRRLPKERMGLLRRNADDPTDLAISRQSAHTRFKAAAESAALPEAKHLRKTHVLRHTRATLLFAGGASVDQVRFYLGHSDAKTTQGYLHVAKELKARYEHSDLAKLGLEGF